MAGDGDVPRADRMYQSDQSKQSDQSSQSDRADQSDQPVVPEPTTESDDTPDSPDTPDDLVAGRYRRISHIGSGGMGVVWKAKDEVLGRTVALKELAAHAKVGLNGTEPGEAARRAMREARIAARLHHPNVIGLYDFVEHDGRPWLVMEYLASRSLADLIAEAGSLPVEEVARIGVLLASALTAAHEADIVHRDVKPANVLLSDDGAVKLTDFGISRATGDTRVTSTGIVLGTVSYIAPEVARGQTADARSDVYSLGATLYSAVEGQPPFGVDDNPIALLYRIAHEDIIPTRRAGSLGPMLMWMLARDPELRPTTRQVHQALETIAVPGAVDPIAPAVGGSLGATTARPSPPVSPSPAPAPRVAPVAPVAAQAEAAPLPQAQAPAPVPTAPRVAAQPPSPAPAPVAARETVRSVRDSTPASKPRRRNTLFIGIVAVLALAVIAGTALLVLNTNKGNTTATGGPQTSASRTSTPGHPVTLPSAQSETPTPTTASTTSAPAQDTTSQLVATIVDYYQLMPGNTDKGWTILTADYQQNHADGRANYNSFWAAIQSVSLTDIEATLPSTVVATIHYSNKDGSTDVERTSFGLVQEDGTWKIASSSVLSHQSG